MSTGCGDKAEEPFRCAEYEMEEFWRSYYEIDCAYRLSCIIEDPGSYTIEECIENGVSGQLSWCDEDGFSPCGSLACIEAWQAEVDQLEAEGRLDECPHNWNLPSEECDNNALMFSHCNTLVDE